MKKIKTLFLLSLCGLAATPVLAQQDAGMEVINRLTSNGGYCQTIYYSASYQGDEGIDDSYQRTTNMYIKDSFGKSKWVEKKDNNGNPVIVKRDPDGVMRDYRVVTLANAFNGLFDWDFYIAKDGLYADYQPYDMTFPVKGNDNQYVRLHMMTNTSIRKPGAIIGGEISDSPIAKVQEYECEWDESLTLYRDSETWWIPNYLGTVSWPNEDSFDYSMFLAPYTNNRYMFLRLAVKEGDVNNPKATDKELNHYDFYMVEFRHYNANTTISDTKIEGDVEETRQFPAMAEMETIGNERHFSIYNFSNFGPCFTQSLPDGYSEENLDEYSGFGGGQGATVSPIVGKLNDDGTILIKRQPGYVHYSRKYEDVGLGEYISKEIHWFDTTGNEILEGDMTVWGREKLDPSLWKFTNWHKCDIAGIKTDGEGNILQPLQLKNVVTGKWSEKGTRHHHADNIKSLASNPWVTNNGTCRTMNEIVLDIDPYVYCTDAQLAENKYDTDDNHGRGGIYKLVNASVGTEDITLQLAIDNKEDNFGNRKLQHSIYAFEKDKGTEKYLACPVMFDVTANEQYVDHYEVCVYRGAGDTPVASADDAAFDNKSSKLNTVMTPTATYILPKNDTGHYEAFELAEDVQKVSSKDVMNHPNYSKVLTVPVDDHDSEETLTFYVKAIYTAESGLAPTYHSLENVLFHINDGFPTAVEDVNVEGVKAVSGVYSINGQYVGTEVPAGNGIYVVRYTDGSAAKVAVK